MEKELAITGSASIDGKLEADTEYAISTVITPYGSDKRSLDNGDFKVKYKAKISDIVVLTKGEKVIMGKDKKKRSVALRNRMWHKYDGDDFDIHYETTMNKLILNWDRVEELINKI